MLEVRFHGRGGQGGAVRVGPDLMTGRPGVFAGGDIVPAERTVTMAIGHGRTAAGHVDARLRGARLAPEPDAVPIPFAGLNTWYYSDAPRSIRPQLEPARRRSTFDEVTGGLDASKGCGICVQECPAGAIAMEPEEV